MITGPGYPQENSTLLESIRHRSCCVKLRYKSIQAAEHAGDIIANKFPADEPIMPYYCVFCNDFHNGHTDGRSATEKILHNIEAMLRFDFRAPCSVCGKVKRFTGKSEPAKGSHEGKSWKKGCSNAPHS